jgi:hypothetical protein
LNREEFQPEVSSNRSLILDQEGRQQIIGEKLRLEVSKAIQEARALAGIEPDNAVRPVGKPKIFFTHGTRVTIPTNPSTTLGMAANSSIPDLRISFVFGGATSAI